MAHQRRVLMVAVGARWPDLGVIRGKVMSENRHGFHATARALPASGGGGSYRLVRRSCPFQALDDLVIACLREVHVELPDAKEIGWGLHAHELVGVGADP